MHNKHFSSVGNYARREMRVIFFTKIYAKYEKDKAEQINSLINKKYSEFVNCYLVSGNAVEIISNKTCKSNAIEEIVQIEKVYQYLKEFSEL